jgi:hypothetical protein
LATTTRYAVRRKVVHEVFDDEVIVVNLENGNYYTLAGSAAEIWKLVITGASAEQIVQGVGTLYQDEPASIEAVVCLFVAELEHELLIAPEQHPADPSDGQPGQSLVPSGLRFEPPVLAKYTDMEQLLVLDPIHDVDESGWPSVAPLPAPAES